MEKVGFCKLLCDPSFLHSQNFLEAIEYPTKFKVNFLIDANESFNKQKLTYYFNTFSVY